MEPTTRDAATLEAAPTTPPEMLYNETYRPQFHFTARQNWINDPNGLVYYKGEFHLFFQHNPIGNEWGNMTWGHAVCRDLLHWKPMPPALQPDEMGTIFSGSAVVDQHNTTGLDNGKETTLIAIYTAAGGTSPASKGKPFTQCMAYSNNRGRVWRKHPRNPILKNVVGKNRDPKVIWHEETRRWIMALYLDKNDFALFSSPNLTNWTHLHNLTVPGGEECPDFFPLETENSSVGTQWVFTVGDGRYLVGSFNGQKFTPNGPPQQVEYGANFYAPQTFSDVTEPDARRIQIAWMRGGKYPGMPFNQQLTFPCVLSLRQTHAGMKLYRWPVREIKALYIMQQRWQNTLLKPGQNPLAAQKGELWDLEAEFELETAAEFGFVVRGETIRYDVATRTLSCLNTSAPLEPEDGHIRIRVLADRSSLEVFGNGGSVSLTNAFLPAPDTSSLRVYAEGGNVRIIVLRVRPLLSAVQGR